MNKRLRFIAVPAMVVSAAAMIGCTAQEGATDGQPEITKAIAVLHATEGNQVSGVVRFSKVDGGVHVVANVQGLIPGSHGFHIHEFGDCSSGDGKSAGGHFNPMAMQHGGPTSGKRHVGDLGNIEADESGSAQLDWTDSHLMFSGASSIIARGVIVHEKSDDLSSQPTGAAGARLACGVIGVGSE